VDQNNDNRIDHDEFAFTTSDSLKRQKHTVEVQIQHVSGNKPFNTTVPFTITHVTDLPPGYRSSAVPGAPDLTYELPFKNRMGTLNSKTFYLNTNFGSHFKKYHQILIDYNRNDTLEMGSGSIESAALDLTQSHLQQTYYTYPNFSLGDQTWEVADVDPEGTWIRLRPSLKNIDRKAIVVGKPAPQWRATTIGGIEISSEALQGKYVLLDFWGSWCGPCIQAIPQLKKVFERFKLQNFTIIGFAYENESSLKRAMEQYELPWPQISDNRGTYRTRFLVSGYPTYYLIGPDGTVLAMGQELRGERLVKTLEKYLE
jgi:thiol-disulfide isomerase/thioredoxin